MSRQAGRFINQGSERCDCGAKPGEAHGLACHPDDSRLVTQPSNNDLTQAPMKYLQTADRIELHVIGSQQDEVMYEDLIGCVSLDQLSRIIKIIQEGE